MATRQDTNKPQEQAKQPQEQAKEPAQQPERQTKPVRAAETGLAPYHGGATARSGRRHPLAHLHDEFDRLFDQLSRGIFDAPTPQRWGANWGLDVREDDDTVTVRAEAPGFEASDFDIRVHGDRLDMHASHRSEEVEEGSRGWRQSEFAESVMLPTGVDADKVKATYRNGVLTVALPKTEGDKPKRVTVES